MSEAGSGEEIEQREEILEKQSVDRFAVMPVMSQKLCIAGRFAVRAISHPNA